MKHTAHSFHGVLVCCTLVLILLHQTCNIGPKFASFLSVLDQSILAGFVAAIFFPSGAVNSLSTVGAVGVAVVTTGSICVHNWISGAGALVFYCIGKHRFIQISKPNSPSHHQQQTVSSASNSLQQTDPEYAEVIKLRQNTAYEFTQTETEIGAD